jgi:macrolide transport system ATP-binding/permease protein
MFQDIRYGLRLLRRSPGFTCVAVVSLAFGLGAGAAIFTVMNALIFRPLPGRDTADIHRVYTSGGSGNRYGNTSYADFRSFVDGAPDLFAGTCATAIVKGNLTVGDATTSHSGALMSGGCFDALKLKTHAGLGRLLTVADERPGANPPAVVISHAVWRRVFHGDPTIVGRSVAVNGVPSVIVGVAEAGFAGLSLDAGAEFFATVPLAATLLSDDTLTARGHRRFAVFVRLNNGVSTERAGATLTGIAAQLRHEYPDVWKERSGSTRTVTVERELDARFAGSPDAGAGISLVFIAAIAAIVAIACVNLATMILARGAARTRELSVRMALGASRGRLLRQLATESLLISAAGTVIGLVVVFAALRVFDAYRPPEIPGVAVGIDWRVLTFSAVMAILAPVLFGVTPGAHALGLAIVDGLKGRPSMMRRKFLRVGPRELLLVVQVTVSFALIITATLFTRSLMEPSAAEPGPGMSRVAVLSIDLNLPSDSEPEMHALTTRLLDAAARQPGVDVVTAAAIVPLTGSYIGTSGRTDGAATADEQSLDANIVAPGYFELVGIARRSGRSFDARDAAGSPRVAVVSESMARRLWNSTAVVGRTVHLDDRPTEVVGVVADAPYRTTDGAPQPVVYVPLAQSARWRFVLHARVKPGGEILTALERAIRAVDPRVVVDRAVPLASMMDQTKVPARVTQAIGVGAGALQLGLALMALWGLVAYAVQRQTAEIAIRRALGATESGIVKLVMRPTVWLLGAGALAGTGLGVVASTLVHAEVIGLAPLDLRAAFPAAIAVGIVVVVAAWLPARRAAMIEPASALKQQ